MIEVDRTTPIRTDTRAQLELQGLTGVATVALVGGDAGAPPLAPPPGPAASDDLRRSVRLPGPHGGGAHDRAPGRRRARAHRQGRRRQRRPDQPHPHQRRALLAGAEQQRARHRPLPRAGRTGGRARRAARGKARVAHRRRPEARARGRAAAGLAHASRTSRASPRRSRRTGRTSRTRCATRRGSPGRLNESAEKLDATLTDVGALVRAVDATRINRSFDNIESFTATLKDNRQNVDQILKDAATLTAGLNTTRTKADTALDDVSKLMRAVDTGMVNRTIANIEGFSLTLAENRQNVDAILRDVAGITRALDVAKINRTIDGAERFATTLGNSSPDVDKMIKEARSLGREAQQVRRPDRRRAPGGREASSAAPPARRARACSTRSARRRARSARWRTISTSAPPTSRSGINRFTGSGLREVETLTAEGQAHAERHRARGAQPRAQSAAAYLRRQAQHSRVQRPALS